MNQDDILRLLLADDSLNDAEMYISVLRNAGHAVRATRIEDDEDLREALQEKQFDLFLCKRGLELLPMAEALQQIQQLGRDIPVVIVDADPTPDTRRESLAAGTADLVGSEDLKHLQLVVDRELQHVRTRRRLRQLEKALKETERRCSTLLDSSRDAIAYVHEGMHIYANPAYLEKFGVEQFEDIEGMPLLDMIASTHQSGFKDFLRNYSKGDHSQRDMELDMVAEDAELSVSVNLSPASIDGEPCTQILIRDRSDTRDLERQLDSLSKQDLATGLYNRTYFQEILAETLGGLAPEEGEPGHGLLLIQMDNSDMLRQQLGINAFDKVIADAAAILGNEMDAGATAARFTDDSIILLLPRVGVHESVALAEAVRQRLENHITEIRDKTVTATCSIGVVVLGANAASADAEINNVNLACETARKAGGNQVHLHAGGGRDADEQATWRDTIEDALAQNRFYCVYMPLASLKGEEGERYEVRVRLRGDDEEERLPKEFITPAEELGLMTAVDRWVVKHAIEQLAARIRLGLDTTLFLKISGATLADKAFLPFLGEQLKSAGVPGKHLSFQVNEPVAVTQLNDARDVFRGLKELGCGFTLDHFGSGLNPFQLVKHLPADYLKLDRSLLEQMDESEEAEERIKGIIENAHSMRKQVVSGYVEDAGTLARLWQHQIDFVQGNFLQPPTQEMNFDFSGMVI
ncbi:diguanylate cyclase (GGDEF)-like protein/PAS domain S-box-containing protein [Natronocella acetinitrilica]|uniref:Diguanylate cyclase (GGDEF)-like protein/PAS domain S-box-containing protein n=1 Tax=Natronocella acetinitrilica TaxID=414046 RepID=A0AAE3G3K2_9GAMM|nr:EAL domain-containing protein [Natronocella acetinitrilica]MCP1673738.1 diguanylate cyclase (GGDEF)-like protein/PAS domain S-box-containing protein [Natronocella acetinitrilica]